MPKTIRKYRQCRPETIKKAGSQVIRAMLLLLLSACLVTACSVVPEPKLPKQAQTAKEVKQAPSAAAPELEALPPVVPLAPEPAMDESSPFDGKLFSFSARKAALRDVLMGLARQADLNIVLAAGVDGDEFVSVEFANLPLGKALAEILQTFEYSYELSGNILRIKSVETRVLHFDYPLVYSTSTSEVGGDMLGSSSGDSGSSGSSDITAEFSVVTQTADTEALNIWKQVKEILKSRSGKENAESSTESKTTGILSEVGYATVDPASGTIIVTDRPHVLDKVENVLEEMEAALKRQVVIEAKIIEVTLNHDHQFGVDWSAIRQGNKFGLGISSKMASNLSDGQGTFQLDMTSLGNAWNLTALIDAISTQGTVNTISSPRLNVINNQSATISVGRTIPYLDFEIETVTSGDTVSYQSVPTVAKAQAGVSLGITPQIGDDDVITLNIVPVVTDQVSEQSFTYDGTSWTVPILDTRSATSIISARDGETLVLGGMMQEVSTDNRTKVPVLGSIPVVGSFLFGNQSKTNEKLELVILLTPRIVRR